MRSFSSFKPVLNDLSPREAKSATFAMFLRANARNLRKPFDRTTWKTARPWLSFNEIRYELKRFRDRSLGLLQLGNVTLENQDVERAVKYEAFATKKIFQMDISDMINNFYEIDLKRKILKRDVLNRINEEFLYLNRGSVSQRDKNWKICIKPFTKGKFLTLRPRIHERDLAALILQLFEICDTPISIDKIQEQITPCLIITHQTTSAPITRRALTLTGEKLRYKNHFELINGIIEKFYVKHALGDETPDRLKGIVNQYVKIPHDNLIWDLIDFKIVPKHDFTSEEYEQAFDEKYHDPPLINPLQVPFFRFKHPYLHVRKKQKINWKNFIDKCTRNGGTDSETLEKANEMLIQEGFTPYNFNHPEFDMIKIQGLKFSV